MGYAIAVTIVIMAGLFYRSSTPVVYAFARRHDRRLFLAAPIAIVVFIWLLYAAWWSAAHF